MTHTPRRWVLNKDGEPFIYQLNTARTNIFSLHVQGWDVDTGERTSKEHRRDIAEFIYRACNAHEELVKIAQAYRNHLKVAAHTDGEVATYQHINDLLTSIEKGA